MNKRISLSIQLGLLVFSFTFVAASMDATSLVAQDLFPDKNLEAVVRQNVFAKRNNTEPLNEKDVENISIVRGKGKGIKNLAGLEKCRSLAELDLAENEIEDIGPIKDLTNIQALYLSKNKIKDIKPLAGLVKLQLLDLSGNEIQDIAPLEQMTNMRTLYLSNNKIENIAVLEKLTKIWTLYLDGNPVKDLKAVGTLKGLTSLNLQNMQLQSLEAIKPLTDLNSVYLQNNKIADLSVLLDMARQDNEGEKSFAPFWRIYLKGNPLSEDAKTKQVAELKAIGSRVHLDQ